MMIAHSSSSLTLLTRKRYTLCELGQVKTATLRSNDRRCSTVPQRSGWSCRSSSRERLSRTACNGLLFEQPPARLDQHVLDLPKSESRHACERAWCTWIPGPVSHVIPSRCPPRPRFRTSTRSLSLCPQAILFLPGIYARLASSFGSTPDTRHGSQRRLRQGTLDK